MGLKIYKIALLCMVLLTRTLLLFCQIEGESEITTINIKKQVDSESGIDDSGERNIKDITPPQIQIISPRLDTAWTANVSNSELYFIGRLTDESGIQSLLINGKVITTDDIGFFQQSYSLSEGLNAFNIQATDMLSNSTNKFVYVIKGLGNVETASADEFEYTGKYYGLIIGIDEYNDPGLVDLDHPVIDATFLYNTLIGNYMFDSENITLLKNPSRADIIKTLDEFSYKITGNDNLLIFYAGHGYWDGEKETGYWLPNDADQFSSVNWIRNSTIQDFIDDINTKHTLLITDACFAGSIFKTRGAFQDAPKAVNSLYSLSSRKAMTSGMLKEVPDRSVFIEYFMKRLLDNDKRYISAGGLFYSFREAVLNNSPNIPQYGVIQDTGDEGGEFIFIRR